MKKRFISLYLPEFTKTGKKERRLGIAFGQDEDVLYDKLKSISTTEIKKILNIHNYNALFTVSEANFIKPTLYIKQVMNRYFSAENKKSPSASSVNKYDKWIMLLEKDHPGDKRYSSLINYLKTERRKTSL